MQRVHDRVKETSTSTGTGNITLAGASTGFVSFADSFILNEPIYYAIVDTTNNTWEVGRGHLLNSTTLVRDKVHESSSFTGVPPSKVYNAVSFAAGSKDVFSTVPAERIEEIFTKGQAAALAVGLAMP